MLKKNGLGGKLLSSIRGLYTEVKSAVRIDCGHITSYFSCNIGVKQGCILSPTLFSMFISELDKALNVPELCDIELCTNDATRTSLLMYADDLCIFSDSVIGLQRKLNILSQFCSTWGLKVNLQKTNVIVFRNGGYLRNSEKWFYKKFNGSNM